MLWRKEERGWGQFGWPVIIKPAIIAVTIKSEKMRCVGVQLDPARLGRQGKFTIINTPFRGERELLSNVTMEKLVGREGMTLWDDANGAIRVPEWGEKLAVPGVSKGEGVG